MDRLISENAVLDAIYNNEDRLYIAQAVRTIPTAEPKTGHWITEDGFDGDVYYRCSECDELWVTFDGTPLENNMHYCPRCGAKMGGEQDG